MVALKRRSVFVNLYIVQCKASQSVWIYYPNIQHQPLWIFQMERMSGVMNLCLVWCKGSQLMWNCNTEDPRPPAPAMRNSTLDDSIVNEKFHIGWHCEYLCHTKVRNASSNDIDDKCLVQCYGSPSLLISMLHWSIDRWSSFNIRYISIIITFFRGLKSWS